jgi:hypothetical protein
MADLVAIVATANLETFLGVFLAVLGTFLLLFAIFSKRRVFSRVVLFMSAVDVLGCCKACTADQFNIIQTISQRHSILEEKARRTHAAWLFLLMPLNRAKGTIFVNLFFIYCTPS